MISASKINSIDFRTAYRSRVLLITGALVLVICFFTLVVSLKSVTVNESIFAARENHSIESNQELDTWLINYRDFEQAEIRHKAFWDLLVVFQRNRNSIGYLNQEVFLNPESSLEMIAIAAGALSSYGTLEAQQVLCNALQSFASDQEKAMIVLPQIMLLENPENFLFDELLAFENKTSNNILQKNSELALAGLWRYADYNNNKKLAQRISFWLEKKKSSLGIKDENALINLLDLLGNTGNQDFLASILEATNHTNSKVREHAAFALRFFKDDKAVNTLNNLASADENLEVRQQAKEALSFLAT